MKNETGVLYFNHSRPHLARLLVSIFSLRKHFSAPICILDTGYSEGVIDKIAADERLAVRTMSIAFVQRRKNSCYNMKASLWRESPFSNFLFLDADTIVANSIAPLIDGIESPVNAPLLVTRFSDWTTATPIIRGRIEKWRGVKADGIIADHLIEASYRQEWPAINTGVFGARTADGQSILSAWERLTHAGWKCPFTDELSMQLIVRKFSHAIASDRFNCSPIYGAEKSAAVIWHAHGSKHVTGGEEGRGAEGHRIWFPIFREAWEANAGGVRDWAPAGDDRLARHLPPA